MDIVVTSSSTHGSAAKHLASCHSPYLYSPSEHTPSTYGIAQFLEERGCCRTRHMKYCTRNKMSGTRVTTASDEGTHRASPEHLAIRHRARPGIFVPAAVHLRNLGCIVRGDGDNVHVCRAKHHPGGAGPDAGCTRAYPAPKTKQNKGARNNDGEWHACIV